MQNNFKRSKGQIAFQVFIYIFLIFAAMLCILPIINILAISLSSSNAAAGNLVKLWPVDFTLSSYKLVIKSVAFFKSFIVSIKRVVLGVAINMFLIVLTAYPLSKPDSSFKARKYYTWFFMITILFNGGLIPWYIVIRNTGLIDSIFALVIPGALPVFNMIVMLNFFRSLPKGLEEAAFIDGASHWRTLWNIYLPLSGPAIATITLFCFVTHWNSWFDGLILMNKPDNYPLQSYLQTIVINTDQLIRLQTLTSGTEINQRTTQSAQIFISMVPILAVYPFLQKYFTKGLILGSIKE